jgi:undecaprenyl diphosphate synthase
MVNFMSDSIKVDERLQHIAFIMDGNGRWAERRGMPRRYGHRYGAEAFKKIVRYCGDIGIKYVTVYAFSTENWSRPEKEVNSIMKLLDKYLDECEKSFAEYNIRMRIIGDLSKIDESLAQKARRIENITKDNALTLCIALNYGGRDELVHAFNDLLARGKTEITAQDIESHLYTAGVPDPDLIVRTAGELRLSNFLMWQSAYSEFYFTDTLWPDMTKKDIDLAVTEFYNRKRRYGKV